MSDYVPYDERVRRHKDVEQQTAASTAAPHRNAVQAVTEALSELAGRSTDCYLEILRPNKGLRNMMHRGPVIHKPGLRGGPNFFIAEVLQAYRVPAALVRPAFKDVSEQAFDGFVVPDGRVWRFLGVGETANTYQFLASSAERLPDLSVGDLQRLASGLPSQL